MGLSQLLAVGRSVRTIKDGPARYKMTQQHLLPKFGGAKVAESPAAESVPPPFEVASELSQTEPVASPPPAEDSAADKGEPGPAKVAIFMEATKKLRPFGGWSLFKNPFNRGPGRKNESGPVQTELSLESVKPVRNDLSDTDFEPARTPQLAVQPPEAPREPAAVQPLISAGVSNHGSPWQRFKTRLFRVTHTH